MIFVSAGSQTVQEKQEKKITEFNIAMHDKIKTLEDALFDMNILISNIKTT